VAVKTGFDTLFGDAKSGGDEMLGQEELKNLIDLKQDMLDLEMEKD